MKVLALLIALIPVPWAIARLDLAYHRRLGRALHWWRQENMPTELRRAALYLCEEDISTRTPVALHGRPDQVYRTADNTLVLLDTKARKAHRVFPSDIIQLSVYRVILAHSQPLAVAPHGYIRTVVQTTQGEEVRYHKTMLLSTREIIALHRQYNAIRQAAVAAPCTCGGVLH